MGEQVQPDEASLDSLIEWLRSQRTLHPTAPLSSLIDDRRLAPQRLLDLACIDLMERRRSGQSIRVESYAEQFPPLQQDEPLLDLIDAEICVQGELQQPIEAGEYQRRFPRLAKQITELLGLDALPASGAEPMSPAERSRPRSPLSTHDDEALDPSASFSVELVVRGDLESNDALPKADGYPLRAPEWFSAEKCFATGPGRWLIRGRDSLRGVVMAMKVVQLPSQLHPSQCRQILDACEAASQVRNPMWIPPTVAAIQHHHLGIIRQWVFATSWLPSAATRDVAAQLADLASIAFCLEAAHRVGAAHGAIHGDNLLLDHDGKLRLVDAVANQDGIQRWFDDADPSLADPSLADPSLVDPSLAEPSIMSLRRRKQTDVEDLIRLIARLGAAWRQTWTESLFDQLAKIAQGDPEGADPEGACGAMGTVLMRFADRSRQA